MALAVVADVGYLKGADGISELVNCGLLRSLSTICLRFACRVVRVGVVDRDDFCRNRGVRSIKLRGKMVGVLLF